MKKFQNVANRAAGFVKNDIWNDPPEAGRLHQAFLHVIRVVLITANSFRSQLLLLRASALAYSTLLAVVPVLAVGFSMLKGLGFHTQIEHVLVNYLTAEQEELTSRIVEYISNTDFKALGALGTAVLIYAVIMMLSNVEGAFNSIWGVTRNRPIVRKISDYISVLLLGPLLMVVSTAVFTSFSSHTMVQTLSHYPVFRDFFALFGMLIPYMGLWIAFTAMYMIMPNTRVRFLPALIAGVVCGSVWALAFEVYTTFNVGMARYNKIYGTFAALPIFIIWIYISWIIVLVGARISNAIQHLKTYQQEFKGTGASFGQRQHMALYIMHEIARHFHTGNPPPTADQISRHLAIPTRLVHEIGEMLCGQGLLREIEGDGQIWQPAMDLSRIRVADVLNAICDHGKSPWQVPEPARDPQLEDLIRAYRPEAEQSPHQISMARLLAGGRENPAP
ncbi:MAG: YihY/virulence factor BrkB family protein [Desulfosalsimonas sp.]|uniref:YihY/virulence factor BrkB family protein n=1 Tax=Desulfosalsimonas sp. TaxID=3073848 RepID=UPI00397115B6